MIDSSTLVAAVLDPRTKLTLFATGEESTKAIDAVKNCFAEYHIPQPQSIVNHNNSEVISTREYFHQLKRRRLNNDVASSITRTSPGIYEEFDRYLALPCDDNVAPLL